MILSRESWEDDNRIPHWKDIEEILVRKRRRDKKNNCRSRKQSNEMIRVCRLACRTHRSKELVSKTAKTFRPMTRLPLDRRKKYSLTDVNSDSVYPDLCYVLTDYQWTEFMIEQKPSIWSDVTKKTNICWWIAIFCFWLIDSWKYFLKWVTG